MPILPNIKHPLKIFYAPGRVMSIKQTGWSQTLFRAIESAQKQCVSLENILAWGKRISDVISRISGDRPFSTAKPPSARHFRY
jgi:hypothetical protein